MNSTELPPVGRSLPDFPAGSLSRGPYLDRRIEQLTYTLEG